MARYVLITDDAAPEDIREAIAILRTKQRACSEDIGADIDELLDMLHP